jgi:hypothetical protein
MIMPEDNRQQNVPDPTPSPKPQGKVVEEVGLRVSLIPVEETSRRNPRIGFKRAVIAVAVAALFLGGVAGYLGYKVIDGRKEASRIKASTEEIERQTAQMSDSLKYAKLMQSRLRSLSSLLDSHRNAAPVFTFLERHTLSEVVFSSIAIAENGTVNLAATAASFEVYAAQMNELRNQPEIRNVVSSGLNPSYGENGTLEEVVFNLVVNFDPSIFLSKAVEG